MKRFLIPLALFALLMPSAMARPPHRGHGSDQSPPPHVIDEVRAQESRILDWLKANDTSSYDRLVALKTSDPRGYIAQLVRASRMMKRASRDPEVVERHRTMRRLERAIQEIVSVWDTEGGAQREQRRQLEELVGQLFELRQADRRDQLKELESRISDLSAEIEQREQERDAIIEAYVDDLVEGPPEL